MSETRDALEAAIDDAPDEPSRYALLADWYQEHGEPRGELIALQLHGVSSAREAELLATQRIGAASVKWRWGFVEALRFERTSNRDDWADVFLAPVLAHPACRFLRALEVDAGPGDQTLRWLAEHGPRGLRALSLTCNEVDLTNVKGRLTSLVELQLAAQRIAPAVLPPLTSLSLPIEAMTSAGLAHVLGTQPSLRELTLSSLEPIDDEVMAAVTQLTKLESLTLRADLTTREAIDALVASPLRDRLVTLELSRSGLSEEAAHVLLAAVPTFRRLSALVVGER